MSSALRARFLRWSRHACRTLPAVTPVQFDLACRCGWHITGLTFADTYGADLMRIGAPLRTVSLSGVAKSLLDHYDACPSGGAG